MKWRKKMEIKKIERPEKQGDGKDRTLVCWEDTETEARGFYEKGSPSDPDVKGE